MCTERFLIHSTGALQFTFAIYYNLKHLEVPNTPTFSDLLIPFGGYFKYLTFLNVLAQMIYFNLALLYDVLVVYSSSTQMEAAFMCTLHYIRDYWFATLAFPMAIFVSVLFWSLYAIDRELIHPKLFDSFFPVWLNHLMHTNVGIYAILEMYCTTDRNYPSRDVALLGNFGFSIVYVIWLHVVRYYTGRWIYPVLNVVNWPARSAFCAFGVILGSCFYFFGEYLHSVLHESKEL